MRGTSVQFSPHILPPVMPIFSSYLSATWKSAPIQSSLWLRSRGSWWDFPITSTKLSIQVLSKGILIVGGLCIDMWNPSTYVFYPRTVAAVGLPNKVYTSIACQVDTLTFVWFSMPNTGRTSTELYGRSETLTPNEEYNDCGWQQLTEKKTFSFTFFEAVLVEPKKPVPLSWLQLGANKAIKVLARIF